MLYRNITRMIVALLCGFIGMSTTSAANASYYSPSSVLTSGRWVKIRVNESGIQQITHKQLKEWGFDDPSKVTVYGFGGVAGVPELLDESTPDDLPQQLVEYRQDRLLFYGEANYRINLVHFPGKSALITVCPDIERNHAADAGYYFITDSQPIKEHTKIPYKPLTSLPYLDYHWEVSAIEEEIGNPAKQGQNYFGRDISQSADTIKFSVPINHLYFDSSAATYSKVILHDVVVGAGSNLTFTLTYPHHGEITTKNINLDNSSDRIKFSSNASYPDSYLALSMPRETTSFDATIAPATNSSFTYAALDRMAFAYQQSNVFGDRASMLICASSLENGRVVKLTEANKDVLIWKVDRAHEVCSHRTSYLTSGVLYYTTNETYNVNSNTAKAHRAIAFDPNKEHLAVEYVEEIENQNIHSYDVPDMVILTADAFVDEAEQLAQIHRDYLGQDVLVLTQNKIFNEFSSGTPSLWGIRKAVKMFYDRNPGKMKHLLLFGGAFFDNRGLTETGASFKERGALLLNYGTTNIDLMSEVTKAYSCDAYFGMMNDTPPSNGEFINNIQHINVGRIPVVDKVQATKAVEKVKQYLTSTPTTDIYQRVLLLADQVDLNSHTISAEYTANSFTSNKPGITLIKGYGSLYPLKNGKATYLKNAILQALKRGVSYVNYTGHGKPDFLGWYDLYHLTDVHNIKYGFYPFAMLATCRSYTFDCLEQSLAQDMVLQSNGGMIAVVGACREVFQDKNETLSETLAEIYSKAPKGTTTGDIFRLSRNQIHEQYIDNEDLMVNTSCYNLCGDPALPLFFSSHNIAIENINNEAFNNQEAYHKITPLIENTISGYVENPEIAGTPWAEFNGNVILSVYNSPLEHSLDTEDGADLLKVHVDEDVLVETFAKVVNGRFSIKFTPPMPIRIGNYNRATITAVLPDNSEVATTHTTALLCDVASAPSTPSDITAPEIESLYINSPDFICGDIVSQDFTVYASVSDDESGICNSTGTIGNNCRILIDNTINHTIVGTAMVNNGDGTINITYPLTSLTDGRHSLTLYIADNAGNTSSREIEFTVNNSSANAKLTVEEEPARVQATIGLTHQFPETPIGKLIIEDNRGNTVYSRENVSFPFEWDLTDTEGNLVTDGIYRAYALCKGGSLYGHTPKIEIIVVQKP